MIRYLTITTTELNFIRSLTKARLPLFIIAVLLTGGAMAIGGVMWLLAFLLYALVGLSFADDSPTWTGLYGARGITLDAARELAQNPYHVLSVARNPYTPPELLVEIAEKPDPTRAVPSAAMLAALNNEAFPVNKLGDIAESNPDALKSALTDPRCSLGLRINAIKSTFPAVRRIVAERKDLFADDYALLGNDSDPTVREVIAGNDAASQDVRTEASGN